MKKEILSKEFYIQKSTPSIAKNLLGKTLVRTLSTGRALKARIVETEAYLYDDPACHTSNGKTKRTEPMFMKGGLAYVYLIYGMYYCFNAVTQESGKGEAILIRAIEPIDGIETMYENRRGKAKIKRTANLTNGPGKLCQAMNINMDFNKKKLYKKSNLYITTGDSLKHTQIITTKRIGISKGKELPLRFYIKNNKFVSKR